MTALDHDILDYVEGKVTGAYVVDVVSDLKDTGQYTQAKVRNQINGLRDRGILERSDNGGRGTKATIRLTTKGIELLK